MPAALATYLAVEALKPDLLINAGTAGGFESKGMAIGDVLVSSTIHNHDRRMLLPIFVDYGVANHTAVETARLREVSHEQARGWWNTGHPPTTPTHLSLPRPSSSSWAW